MTIGTKILLNQYIGISHSWACLTYDWSLDKQDKFDIAEII